MDKIVNWFLDQVPLRTGDLPREVVEEANTHLGIERSSRVRSIAWNGTGHTTGPRLNHLDQTIERVQLQFRLC